jgi:hypothetical protein
LIIFLVFCIVFFGGVVDHLFSFPCCVFWWETKKMSNTDPTKNTRQKTKKMRNTDLTKNTIQKTKKMIIFLVFCIVFFGGVCVAHLFSFLYCVFGEVRVSHLFSFLSCVSRKTKKMINTDPTKKYNTEN